MSMCCACTIHCIYIQMDRSRSTTSSASSFLPTRRSYYRFSNEKYQQSRKHSQQHQLSSTLPILRSLYTCTFIYSQKQVSKYQSGPNYHGNEFGCLATTLNSKIFLCKSLSLSLHLNVYYCANSYRYNMPNHICITITQCCQYYCLYI